MSKLDELIQKLCPDGVEFKPLTEVFNTRNGYTPSKSNSEFWENGTVPWFRMEDIRENGRILSDSLQHVSASAVKGSLFPANSIIVATSATIGEHALITVDSLANQRFTYLVLKDEYKDAFDIKFLYYYCFKLDTYCLACLNQGNFASVDMTKFGRFLFPVPPLEVQREIVRILDAFTQLTTELTTELTARKKQYEYYRDELLAANDNVQFFPLNYIAKIYDGTHQTPEYKDCGIPFISVENIGDIYNSKKYITKEAFETYKIKPQKGDLFMTRIGSVGVCAVFDHDAEIAYYVSLALIRPDESIVTAKYLKYIIESSIGRKELRKRTLVNAVPIKVNKDDIGKIVLPIPSLETQNQIVRILDRFDTLCNDISAGLPAEIGARQKQYEYYRDKLLTFKEVGA